MSQSQPASETVLEVRDLHVSYGAIKALKGVSLHMNEGEIVTLIGALVLALIPDLVRWSVAERRALVQVIRAKASADELDYLRRLQRHKRLRRAIIELGTQTRTDEHAGRDES